MEEKKYLNSLIENLSGTSDAANEFFSQIIEKYGTNKNSPKDDIELVDSIDKYILQESKKITPKKKLTESTEADAPTSETSKNLDDQIIRFFRSNKSVTDELIENKANELGMSGEKFRNKIYEVFGKYARLGKHYYVPNDEFDPQQLREGIRIEHEHVSNDSIALLIAKDHLSEDGCEKYYSYLPLAEELMKNNIPLDKIKSLLKNKEIMK